MKKQWFCFGTDGANGFDEHSATTQSHINSFDDFMRRLMEIVQRPARHGVDTVLMHAKLLSAKLQALRPLTTSSSNYRLCRMRGLPM